MSKHVLRWSFVLFILNGSLSALAGLPLDRYTVVARTGQALSNSGGLAIQDIDAPSLSGEGSVSFLSTFTGPGVNAENMQGILSGSQGALDIVARTGDPAVGVDGEKFVALTLPSPTVARRIAFQAFNSPDFQQGIWSNHSGTLALVAHEFQQLAGEDDVQIRFPTTPFTTQAGEVAFYTNLVGPEVTEDNNSAIVAVKSDGLYSAIREGDSAPLLEAGTRVGEIRSMHLTQDGSLGVQSELRGPDINELNDAAFWINESPSGFRLIARENEPAPGLPIGVTYGELRGTEINSNHQAALIAALGGAIASEDRFGIFLNDNVGTHPIYVSDDPLPGLPADLFAWYPQSVQITDEGAVVSTLSLHATSRFDTVGQGIWIWPSGSEPQIVAYEGQTAPGLTDATFDYVAEPAVSNSGQLFFAAILKGSNVTSQNNIGVWSAGVDRSPELLWRTGDLFEIEPGVLKTISAIGFYNVSSEGMAKSVNDLGQLAVRLSFTDGTNAVVVTDADAVPEPSAIGLELALVFLGTLLFRNQLLVQGGNTHFK